MTIVLPKKLASLGDIYINDAFSSSHREQASIHKITKYLKHAFGGPLLKKELKAINSVIQSKKGQLLALLVDQKFQQK